MTDLSKITCIEDLRLLAKRRVPRMFYDYAEAHQPDVTQKEARSRAAKDLFRAFAKA